MSLYEKIIALYPELAEHPTLDKPTDEELA